MKKTILAGLFATAVSGAQAEGPQAPTQCSDEQTRIVSAVQGLIGCRDTPAMERPMILAQSDLRSIPQVSRSESPSTSPFTGSIAPIYSSQFGNG